MLLNWVPEMLILCLCLDRSDGISDFKRQLSEYMPVVAGYWLQSFISCLFIAYYGEL